MTSIATLNNPPMNSTTYADLLGILVGLTRMPGETSDLFLDRVTRAGVLKRTPDYVGLMNELHLQFGFDLSLAISIACTDPYTLSVDLAGVHLTSALAMVNSPLMTIGPEDFWEWRMFSDIVADLNAATGVTATLLVDDAPAFQLPYQSNTMLAVAEPISGDLVRLAHSGFQLGTESFNMPVPSYSLRSDSVLEFTTAVPTGAFISYRYKVNPYTLIASPVFLISMMDPNLSAAAATPDRGVAYQVMEFVQELVENDPSYWAK